jgi:hypothetical protein
MTLTDRPRDGVPWDDVRRDYETRLDLTLEQICESYRTSLSSLRKRITRGRWTRRKSQRAESYRGKRDALARLKRLAQRRVERLEREETDGAGDHSDDAAIARMTALLRLIERISTLAQKEKAVERAHKPPHVVNDARRLELARRIESIQRQLELERSRQLPE